MARECRRRGCDGVVCGHIQHAEMRSMHGVQYHNCGDWVESCTALGERMDGTIEIIRWSERAAAAKPVFPLEAAA